MKSNILILGDRTPHGAQLNFTVCHRFADLPLDPHWKIDVIALPVLMAQASDASRCLHFLLTKNPWVQFVLISSPKVSPKDLSECINKFPVFQILDNSQIDNLEYSCLAAIEKSRSVRQNLELENLIKEQHELLKNLYHELELRVEKRQAFLLEAKQKSLLANVRWQMILKATEAVHQAETLREIERSLCNILGPEMNILSIRVFPTQQGELFRSQQRSLNKFSIYETELTKSDDEPSIGSVFFLKNVGQNYSREEIDFLQKISEVISLAIHRLYKLDQAYALKDHWEVTFDAVKDPVLILDQNYEVKQFNTSLAEKAELPLSEIKGQKCYKILFNYNAPCKNCRLGEQFQIEASERSTKKTFKVFSQCIENISGEKKLYVNQYHDITEQLRMQAKIIESARMAEIGTIGSSIAHELNNPLGGMLSFTQIIKMDLEKSDPLYSDIVELETGIKRCRDIIQNLLSFSRSTESEKMTQIDLRDVITRAIKIIEIQSRTSGIAIKYNQDSNPIYVDGIFGQLIQAIQNILQLSVQDCIKHMRQQKTENLLIEIRIQRTTNSTTIFILDNSPAYESRDNLSVSITRQIIRDHQGEFEFFPDQKPFKLAKISLPNPASV